MIAAVTVGIYMGWRTPELTTPEVRLLGESVWEIVMFALNAMLLRVHRAPAAGDPRRARRLLRRPTCSGGRSSLLTVILVRASGCTRRPGCRGCSFADPRTRADAAWAALALIPGPGCAAGLARRRARDPAHHRRGRAVPRARPRSSSSPSPYLRDARPPGPDLPAVIRALRLEDDGEDERASCVGADPAARPPCAARRARRRGLGARTRPSGCGAPTTSARTASPLARRRRRRRDRGALRATSGCAASCSTPSGRPCTSCGGAARSPTTCAPGRARPRPRGLPARDLMLTSNVLHGWEEREYGRSRGGLPLRVQAARVRRARRRAPDRRPAR